MQEPAVISTSSSAGRADSAQHSKDSSCYKYFRSQLGFWLPEITPDLTAHFEKAGNIKRIGQPRANNLIKFIESLFTK